MPRHRYVVVTVDTEVDRDSSWRIPETVSFDSVRLAIRERLAPLLDEFGVIATYLISPEVLEDFECVATLASLRSAELGTHLHGDFVTPKRTISREEMGGTEANEVQCDYPPELEFAKLETLTKNFESNFGFSPKSFRAGRFGLSQYTLEFLSKLGYLTDSSITPGMHWSYGKCMIDHSKWGTTPTWVTTRHGGILELPIGIRHRRILGRTLPQGGRLGRRIHRLVGNEGLSLWFRPSWHDGSQLISYVRNSRDNLLVLMFHSNELVAGASPYCKTDDDVESLLSSLRRLFEYCSAERIRFCSMADCVSIV